MLRYVRIAFAISLLLAVAALVADGPWGPF